MLSIPFGNVLTYGDIARVIANNHNIPKMSAQAVGNAVGSNPICLIIPCHRVVGANNRLGGYGGGLENKKALLRLEGRG
jgi:methylated-DNA-[protein]-cysteine S-methyltransferase